MMLLCAVLLTAAIYPSTVLLQCAYTMQCLLTQWCAAYQEHFIQPAALAAARASAEASKQKAALFKAQQLREAQQANGGKLHIPAYFTQQQ
jgi:hypothetical protein